MKNVENKIDSNNLKINTFKQQLKIFKQHYKMRVLVFDTETTGLPKTKIINPDTLHLWPHIVQFSYLIYDTELNDIIKTNDNIVQVKEDVNIPEDSIKFHGITNEISREKGIPLETILTYFFNHLSNVDLLVGHNVSFDINMVKVELMRMIYSNLTEDVKDAFKYNLHHFTNFKNICCTLQDSIELCNIQAFTKLGKPYLKFPQLIELHDKLFETKPNHLHNSLNDILITLRCFAKMKLGHDLNETCDKFKGLVETLHLL